MNTKANASLAGRTVLITGASSGLGARFARIVSDAGANVVIGARRVDRLDALTAEIEALGGQALAVALDVADEAAIIAAYDAAEARFGPVTGVIANAGINIAGSAVDLLADDLSAILDINVRGVFLTAREATRRLNICNRAAEGRIVLISSVTALMQTTGTVAYSASKAAVSHMARVMAREWSRSGPNVNILSPGYIKTELVGDWFDTEGGARQLAKWPRRRLLEPDALDTMLLYLLSDGSAGITGSDFVIDDGQSL